MSRTVVMYNVGKKMLCRLYISMKTLRKYWDGHVIVLAEEPHHPVKEWCEEFDIEFMPVEFSTPKGRKTTYLNACEVWKFTQDYKSAMWLDSDTVVMGGFNVMFEAAEATGFAICNFSDWPTATGMISKRIKDWKDIYPDKIEIALNYGTAINCGVFAYSDTSTWMREWHDLAIPGRDISFIPDETCCQLHLPFYRHKLMPKRFNLSCKYSTVDEDTRILHYHGNKHCRIDDVTKMKKEIEELEKELKDVDFVEEKETIYEMIGKLQDKIDHPYLNNCSIWYNLFETCRDKLMPYVEHDRQLSENLPKWDSLKER